MSAGPYLVRYAPLRKPLALDAQGVLRFADPPTAYTAFDDLAAAGDAIAHSAPRVATDPGCYEILDVNVHEQELVAREQRAAELRRRKRRAKDHDAELEE